MLNKKCFLVILIVSCFFQLLICRLISLKIQSVNVHNTCHIFWKFVSGQVFDILVDGIDYISQFFIVNDFLVHVHCHPSLKYIVKLLDVCTNNLCNCRTPKTQFVVKKNYFFI